MVLALHSLCLQPMSSIASSFSVAPVALWRIIIVHASGCIFEAVGRIRLIIQFVWEGNYARETYGVILVVLVGFLGACSGSGGGVINPPAGTGHKRNDR